MKTRFFLPSLLLLGLSQNFSLANLSEQIEVEVLRNDLPKAIALLDQTLKSESLTHQEILTYSSWRKTLGEWKLEPKREWRDINQVLSQANYFIHLARIRQKDSNDPSSNMLLLRSMTVIQDFLSLNPANIRRSELFLLLGIAYERLGSSQFGSFPETYFDACMRNATDSKILRQCRTLYERRTGVDNTAK